MAKKKLCIACQRRLSILMVVVGSLFVVLGVGLFTVQNRPGPMATTSVPDVVVEKVERVEEEPPVEQLGEKVEEESPVDEERSLEMVEEEKEEVEKVEEVDVEAEVLVPITYFSGDLNQWKVVHYRIADGEVLASDGVPEFHGVASMMVEEGTNLKTGNPSDNLMVNLSAVPDRLFTLGVLVSELSGDGMISSPDLLVGEQWLISYVDGAFVKTARVVLADGAIEDHESEDFNIRFAGNDGSPEVIFYGMPGTKFYGFMVYDEEFFTLITPESE